MKVEELLKEIKEPKKYKRENKDCYYDTYRKKLIEITPEETVRQKVAALFEQKFNVPKEMIALEVPMSYYVEGGTGRADIIIHQWNEESKCQNPLTIIECKNETVFLTDKVTDQAIRYCDMLFGKYFIVTNGIDIKMAVYDETEEGYRFLDKILSYEEMVSQNYTIPKIEEKTFSRFSMEELRNQELIKEYNEMGSWIFGAGTNDVLRSFAVNLYQALLDESHKLPIVKRQSFELIEDIGQRFMDYGNAGGGHYVGDYRSFLVNDSDGEPQIVSVSLFGTDADFRGENRSSYTSLVVSIDRFKTSHNSLQYNVDRFAIVNADGKIKFPHNGQIGSYKSSEVVKMVSDYGDGVKVIGDTIRLGEVDASKLIYLDDRMVAEFVYNLIEYALLRENVRKNKK